MASPSMERLYAERGYAAPSSLPPLVTQPARQPPVPLKLHNGAANTSGNLQSSQSLQLETRLGSLEDGVKNILGALATIQTDLVELKQRSAMTTNVAAGRGGGTEMSPLTSIAEQRLEAVIARTHQQFATYDTDSSGTLDVAELTSALNALGSLKGGRKLTVEDCSKVLSGYDEDRNGGLDSDEFATFITDLAQSGRFRFNDELQSDVDAISKEGRDNPWSSAKHDRDVRGMIDSLRGKMGGRHRQPSGASLSPSSFRRSSTVAFSTSALPGKLQIARFRLARSAERTCAKLCCCCQLLPVINPDGRMRSCWNGLMAFLIIYCGVAVPLEVAFEPSMALGMGDAGWRSWWYWNLSVDCVRAPTAPSYQTRGTLPASHTPPTLPPLPRHRVPCRRHPPPTPAPSSDVVVVRRRSLSSTYSSTSAPRFY